MGQRADAGQTETTRSATATRTLLGVRLVDDRRWAPHAAVRFGEVSASGFYAPHLMRRFLQPSR